MYLSCIAWVRCCYANKSQRMLKGWISAARQLLKQLLHILIPHPKSLLFIRVYIHGFHHCSSYCETKSKVQTINYMFFYWLHAWICNFSVVKVIMYISSSFYQRFCNFCHIWKNIRSKKIAACDLLIRPM